ncbi:hypothetical protein GCM10010256_01470 [Streptomyces coeruleorubidus]|uniref:Uncharacterized protein n=1 Tax=Streptomyces coeruleorubidus TaxID=116188 RepID=A0A5J6I9Y4_STRC4|nr:hypothetical protein CP976_16850 [Streptomyces coeruleorubidus]GGT48984.1 hypothetical protein GCM10010256_01470 [Streptomyces coeruleorubidus]
MPHEKWSPRSGDTERTLIPDNCRLCDALVPDGDAAGVVQGTGRHGSVQYPVCEDCQTPEFHAYLDELWAFWKGGGGPQCRMR